MQYAYEIQGVPFSAYAAVGTYYDSRSPAIGRVTVQELGKQTTYAPEPANLELVGAFLLSLAVLRSRVVSMPR